MTALPTNIYTTPNQSSADWLEEEALLAISGRARIDVHDDATFTFDPEGGVEAEVHESFDDDGELLDLVAWLPANPLHWFVRVGQVPIFGIDAVERAERFGCGIYLARCPAAVVEARLRGHYQTAAVLDWNFSPAWWLTGIEITCQPDTRQRLIEARDRIARPRLSVRLPVDREASLA